MVEVVDVETFNELKKFMEEKLDDVEKRLEGLSESVGAQKAEIDEALDAVHKRIDALDERSKSVFSKVKEALKFE